MAESAQQNAWNSIQGCLIVSSVIPMGEKESVDPKEPSVFSQGTVC